MAANTPATVALTRAGIEFTPHHYEMEQLSSDEATYGEAVAASLGVAPQRLFKTLVAEAMLRIREESGPAAILNYRSGGSLGMMKKVSDGFFEAFGPVTVKSGDICAGAGSQTGSQDRGHTKNRGKKNSQSTGD